MPHASRYFLGMMAGTSGDGIDAALVRIDAAGTDMRVGLLLHRHTPFKPRLRRRLLAAMAPADTTTQELARLHAELGDAFADAAVQTMVWHRRLAGAAPGDGGSLQFNLPRPEAGVSPPSSRRDARRRRQAGAATPPLAAIGLAGQTVCHLPDSRPGKTVTLQLGDPARVAARTGVPVVAEFRQSDVAAGGQGAPLVPWTDWVLFRDPEVPRAVQNIGGIGNVTWLPPGARPEDVVAFDTGPGNMIIDGLVARITSNRQRMDTGGRRAARGRILPGILDRWLAHPFLKQPLPRSTGRETFGHTFLDREWPRLQRASRRPDDWIATATAFTARTITESYQRFLPGFGGNPAQSAHAPRSAQDRSTPRTIVPKSRRASGQRGGAATSPTAIARRASGRISATAALHGGHHLQTRPEVIVCGGGSLNPALLAMLAADLAGATIRTIDSFGIPTQAKEALSFAMLAAARLDSAPANLPQVTGARGPVVMGHLVIP